MKPACRPMKRPMGMKRFAEHEAPLVNSGMMMRYEI